MRIAIDTRAARHEPRYSERFTNYPVRKLEQAGQQILARTYGEENSRTQHDNHESSRTSRHKSARWHSRDWMRRRGIPGSKGAFYPKPTIKEK